MSAPTLTATQPALIGLTQAEIETVMQELGEPKFRAGQVYRWLYTRCATEWGQMTNLAKGLREKLAQRYTVGTLALAEKQVSRDGTAKYLFALNDGKTVEAVLMYFENRDSYALCLSTQAGCAVNCGFCATGKLGFLRQLTAGEIVEQFVRVKADSGVEIRNVVLMGQGEPLLNYDNVLVAVRLLNDGCEVGMRHITLSTSGIIPGIDRLADEGLQLTLAVSLHAPDNATRDLFMPINQKYPLEKLLPSLHHYVQKTNRRLTVEYILLAGVNDSPEQGRKLGHLLRGLHCNVNLIPYNPIGEQYDYARPDRAAVAAFEAAFTAVNKAKVTVRVERGVDIAAACGQLSNQYLQADSAQQLS